MKAQAFKNLIKEAIREVLKEELGDIIQSKPVTEQVINKPNPTYKPIVGTPVHSNPINAMLDMTRQSMTSADYSNLVNENRVGLDSPMGMEVRETADAGLDLNSLGFLKNASAIFKGAMEKGNNTFLP